MQKRETGLTLMELMVVIVIVAILAAVAVPLYVQYVHETQRTEAKAAIKAVITAEQSFFHLNSDGGAPEYSTDTFVVGGEGQNLNCDLTDALKNWDIAVIAADTNGYTVVATGKAGAPTEGRGVQLVHTRTGQPGWTEH